MTAVLPQSTEQPLMASLWSHRPQSLHLGLFIAAYVLGCGFAQLLAIVPGTGISIWPPSGLFIATLILAPRQSWPWWLLAGCIAELFSNFVWFHSPLPAAFLIYAGNALEAMAGAWLVTRTLPPPVRLETLREVLAFVFLGAGLAPTASATVGAATLAWFGMQSQSFAAAWPLFWIGDATGILIVAPLALVVLQNWRGEAKLSTARWVEAGVLGLIFLGVAALSLSGYLPFAYIIMPPLLWAAVRFEFKGAAVTLALLALITAVFTISGASEFAGDPASLREKHVMLQLFLAVSAFSALIVAAISRQHQLALATSRQSERSLRELVDVVPVAISRHASDGEPTFFNKRLMDFLGLGATDKDMPGINRLAAAIHPDDSASFKEVLNHSLATGAPFSRKYRLRRADGAYRWVEGRAEPMRDQSGSIAQWYAVSLDIDDEVRAQKALRDRELELSQLVDMVPGHLWRLTPAGEPIFFNKRMIDFLGLDVADADRPGMTRLDAVITTVVHPDDAARVRDALAHSLATGERFSLRYRLRRADGAYRWMSSQAEPMHDQEGRIVQWYGLCHDIDDQMRAEEALRQSERRLQEMIDAVPVRIWSVPPTGAPISFNKRYLDYLRSVFPDLESLGEPRFETFAQELLHPEDAAKVTHILQNCFETGRGAAMRFRWREKDGAYPWAECRVEPRRDADGKIVQWYGVSIDVDEEVRAQEALRKRERELSLLVDMVPSNLWRLTPDGETTLANKRMADFLGLDLTDTRHIDEVFATSFHPDDAMSVSDALSHCLRTGESFAMRYRLRRWDGAFRWMSGRAEPMRDETGSIVQWFGLCHDIDDQVHAEDALRRASSRLAQATQAASLAELSASIAHEVNQPLAAIVTNSHACHRWLSADPPNVERAIITAERITRDANAAANVVNRIRALFRRAHTRSPEDVNRLIGEVCRLMTDEIEAKNIRIKTDLMLDVPRIDLDRVQVQQIFVNIIRNGIEAMDGVEAGARALQIRSSREGANAIRIEIRDAGTGFKDPERLFEPFFTTKENGMGMGLAICRSIVESHGGRLWAENNEGKGATFIFTLPVDANADHDHA